MSDITLAGCLEETTAPIKALIHEIVAERDALRQRNEKLERVAVAAANVVGSRSKCPVFGPYSDVATIPLDELETALRDVSYLREATLSDLDKEDT